MNEEVKETSSAYRNSRRNTSFLCGIGIAWAAAQFEFSSMSLSTIGGVNIKGASIPILISILCIYNMFRCTLEYMMQQNPVRRWPLAQIDYRITLYLVRFTLIVLSVSAIARTIELVFWIGVALLVAALGFFGLTYALIYIIMPLRLYLRRLQGKLSVASAAFEAMYYSLFISGVVLVLLVILIGANVVNPFDYLGVNVQGGHGIQLPIVSGVMLAILFSFFFDGRFLEMVFAFEPVMIEKKYYDENGIECFSIEPNPAHPEYEKHKNTSPLKYRVVKPGEKLETSTGTDGAAKDIMHTFINNSKEQTE